MYESFFELRQRPFAAAARAERFFPAKTIESARTTLTRIIQRAEGAGVIIGPSGTGKTLLCQVLAEQFRATFASVLLASGRLCTRRALLQAILFELQLPYKGLEEGELRLSLIDHLVSGTEGCQGMLLLVDEAHALPWRLLEELRMITNLVRDGQPRVRIVLAGGPQLEERFASPKLDSFSQRLAARCYLGTMDREDTTAFVHYQIKAAGGDAKRIFAHDAFASIYQATDGVPRLVNQVCDHALILAGLAGCRLVSSAVIHEAWSDLQQLPTPWQPGMGEEIKGGREVVEFAMLDDDDAPEAIPFPQATVRVAPFDAGEQLHLIEQQLSELEDDFEPAGSIVPEVDLLFSAPANPFQEAFEEEEVVIDRFAALGADLFSQRPIVASREGRELGRLLEGFEVQSAAPQLAPNREPSAASAEATHAGQAPFETRSVITMADRGAAIPMIVAEQLVSDIKQAISNGEDDLDHDLIVLDDEVPATPIVPKSTLVRRQEYRQLFASLRRG